MGDTDFRELLVDLIGYASIVSAAIFGLIGLFTEYKKDGKVTLWGRLAAGGIGLSAVFAMTSAVLQKQLNTEQQEKARKAAANERARQQDQFNVQLGQLLGLNRQMGGVNQASRRLLGQMQTSLAGQQRSLLLTTALGAQQRESTSRVLLSMWNESTRVKPDGIEVVLSAICESVRPGHEFPRLFPDNIMATLRAVPLARAQQVKPFSAFSLAARLPQNEVDNAMNLTSLATRVTVQRATEAGEDIVFEIATFNSFESGDAYRVIPDRPEDWEGLAIEFLAFIPQLNPAAAVNAAMLKDRVGGIESLGRDFTVPPDFKLDPGSSMAVLPCDAGMALSVNGRYLTGLGRGRFIVMTTKRGVGLLVKFPIGETPTNIFPRFGKPVGPDPRSLGPVYSKADDARYSMEVSKDARPPARRRKK